MLVAEDTVEAPATASPRDCLERDPARGSLLPLLLILLALLPAIVDSARVLRQGALRLLSPVPSCATENHIVDGIRAVAERRPLYPRIDGLPWVVHVYQPLTYLPAGFAGRWLGLDFDGLLVAGRILSFVSALALLALLAWYGTRETGRRWAGGIILLLLLFYHSAALPDFFRNRPETPAILLSLVGWILVQTRPRGWAFLAGVAFVGAIGLKPTFLAAPVACGLQFLLERDFKSLVRLTLTAVLLSGAFAASAWWLLGAGYFQHTVLAMASNPLDPVAGCRFFYPILVERHWGLLLPAALLSVCWLAREGRDRPLRIYLLVCLAWTSIAHGKSGADLNYHSELSVLMILAVGMAFGRMRVGGLAWSASLAILAAAIWLPLMRLGPGWNTVDDRRIDPRPHAFAVAARSSAVDYAARYQPDRDSALVLDNEIAARLGDPVLLDWYAIKIYCQTDFFDFDKLLAAVRDHRYRLLVLKPGSEDRYNNALMRAAIQAGYRVRTQDSQVVELAAPTTFLPH